jgi:hypothetical protein
MAASIVSPVQMMTLLDTAFSAALGRVVGLSSQETVEATINSKLAIAQRSGVVERVLAFGQTLRLAVNAVVWRITDDAIKDSLQSGCKLSAFEFLLC